MIQNKNDPAYSCSTRVTKEPKCRQMQLLTDLWIRWRQVPAGPAGDFSDDGHHLLRESGHQGLILKIRMVNICYFFQLVLSWAVFGVSFNFLHHILTRNIDIRMRNDINGFYSRQSATFFTSLPPRLEGNRNRSFTSITPPYLPIQHKIVLLLPYHLLLHLKLHIYQKLHGKN